MKVNAKAEAMHFVFVVIFYLKFRFKIYVIMKRGKEMNKLNELKGFIDRIADDGLCIAFSGGVDSSLILRIASETGKEFMRLCSGQVFILQQMNLRRESLHRRWALRSP